MPHNRFALSLAALLLGATCLAGPAYAGWFDFGASKSAAKTADKADKKPLATPDVAPAQDLDGSIRQAQLLRTDGHYDEAIKHLSQIMIVAADDPRVVTEYGKTLAAMGRASDAINFLTRAQQLSPNDWTVYSALGVAYDQTGNQRDAAAAYEHALALKPGESSVLNNYALSRMLAKDPDGAKRLMARAESAGGGTDPKIAHNIAMLKGLTPVEAIASAAPAQPMAHVPPSPAPRTAVVSRPMPQAASGPRAASGPQVATAVPQARPFVNIPQPPVAQAAPRPLVAANSGVIQAQPQPMLQQIQPRGVVMQQVPVDPLAGPVLPKHIAAAIPSPPKASAAKAPVKQAQAAPAPQTASGPQTAPGPVKTAAQSPAAQANDLEARAEAISKQLDKKVGGKAQAMAEANKPTQASPAPPPKPEAKPAVKAADAKPAPVKTAAKTPDAKPVAVKTAAKDAVPALRVSASAY